MSLSTSSQLTAVILLYIFLLILSVYSMSLCVCVWAILPDSNKMTMMITNVIVPILLFPRSL